MTRASDIIFPKRLGADSSLHHMHFNGLETKIW